MVPLRLRDKRKDKSAIQMHDEDNGNDVAVDVTAHSTQHTAHTRIYCFKIYFKLRYAHRRTANRHASHIDLCERRHQFRRWLFYESCAKRLVYGRLYIRTASSIFGRVCLEWCTIQLHPKRPLTIASAKVLQSENYNYDGRPRHCHQWATPIPANIPIDHPTLIPIVDAGIAAAIGAVSFIQSTAHRAIANIDKSVIAGSCYRPVSA